MLRGWNSENDTLNIKLRDTVFDQIFTRFRVKSLIGMAPAENDEDMEEPESVLWYKCRKTIAKNLRRSPASQPLNFKWFQSKSM